MPSLPGSPQDSFGLESAVGSVDSDRRGKCVIHKDTMESSNPVQLEIQPPVLRGSGWEIGRCRLG